MVCSTWHQAVQDTTTQVKIHASVQHKVDHFLEWLQACPHQANITHLKACGRLSYGYRDYDLSYTGRTLLLPASQLQGLQVLDLTDVRWGIAQDPPGTAAVGRDHSQSAAALTALTRLRMCGIAEPVSTSALAGLTRLADLEACPSAALRAGPINSHKLAAEKITAAVADALPHLQQLTRLRLAHYNRTRCDCSLRCPYHTGKHWTAQFSCLQQLKSLQIDQQTISCSSFEVLPTTLTSLEISESLYRPGHSISLSRTPGICQLPGLKQLRLSGVTLDTAVLAHLTSLTALSITSSGIFCSTGAEQLVPLSHLTSLHSLHLRRLLRRQDDSSSDDSYVLP